MGGPEKSNFSLLCVVKMSLRRKVGGSKKPTFSLHTVRKNCHFLDHPPTPMSLRNIKMAPKGRKEKEAPFVFPTFAL